MAPKKGAKKVTEKLSLAAVVNCGEPGYIFTFPDEHAELLAAGYVQVNPELTDPNAPGAIATAATQAGIDFINSQNGAPVAPKEVKVMDAFVIETSSEMPVSGKRGGGRSTVYPFDQLPAPTVDVAGNLTYAFFFVPATTERPEPVKSLASTVSSANARFATPDPSGATRTVTRGPKKGEIMPAVVYSRKFKITAGEKDGAQGAKIWRIL